MKHSEAEDEVLELAALYALGMLEEGEAQVFEAHLKEGCDLCSGELSAFECVAADLGFAAGAETPSEETRGKLEALIASEAAATKKVAQTAHARSRGMKSIRTQEIEWHEVNAGIFIKRLSVDKETGLATSLVKMAPGKKLARHKHNGSEQLFILEGDCHLQGEELGPGDYHRAEDGSIHESTFTVGGTTFLLIAPVTYKFLD